MKNSIICFVLIVHNLIVSGQTFVQKDTLRFAPDSSYSRAIARFGDDLLFGTSKTGVVLFNETTNSVSTTIPPSASGEFRDLVIYKNRFYGMVSGDNGELRTILSSFGRNTEISDPGVFYDDITLYKHHVIVLGDPVDGHFFLRESSLHQLKNGKSLLIPAITCLPDEACYAASGTTAQVLKNGDYCFVSGGKNAARFHRFSLNDSSTYRCVNLPMTTGEGAGPFSVYFRDNKHGVIVGGNYTQPKDSSGTAVYTTDGGKTWLPSIKMPAGYRSCVTGFKKVLYACGTTGIDYSTDGGKTWNFFDSGNFCALLVEKGVLYATTNKGICIQYLLK